MRIRYVVDEWAWSQDAWKTVAVGTGARPDIAGQVGRVSSLKLGRAWQYLVISEYFKEMANEN